MVTCRKMDSANLIKMNRRSGGSMASSSSGFRLLDSDQNNNFDTISSISRNSIYKQKIDLMFDDTRSVASQQRLDDRTLRSSIQGSLRHGSIRTQRSSRSGAYGVGGGGGSGGGRGGGGVTGSSDSVGPSGLSRSGDESRRVHNQVQAQIEKMFTDVAKDATSCSFPVRCLGSLPLKDKVTSLLGLQEPLRQLYLSGAGHGNQNAGNLDISTKGLRVRLTNGRDPLCTPFHNIAVWSAVKFVVSSSEGGAAFLPLITDPENIDKRSLFQPLTAADKRRLSSGLHAPIVAVVMRSTGVPKQLECHGFVCQTPEDAIVIAATLYQSLMAHMSNGTAADRRTRRPKNRNGISCISIASSSATTSNNLSIGMSTFGTSIQKSLSQRSKQLPSRPPRKKRNATSSLSGESDAIREAIETETSTEERKKKSSKTKRAPPIPLPGNPRSKVTGEMYNSSLSYLKEQHMMRNGHPLISEPMLEPPYQTHDASGGGDILTRVAIPRSGSFLNTGGLTRYKSRATRRAPGKIGGGGGSPLGFSELFNEFKLQENLHSLDEILNAIIDSDGMSFNDLKPIYKEFLLKLAVTLTKDELYQRSKSIMRRQKKKKLRKKNVSGQTPRKKLMMGAKSLKKVFRFGRFRKNKSTKAQKSSSSSNSKQQSSSNHQLITEEALSKNRISHHLDSHRGVRATTSGSDVSELRHETTMNGQNRNSSSGYVSCSECSYDSEACTCASADRCYCSLGADHDVAAKLEATKKQQQRHSMFSCGTEDKCYCSVGDGAHSQTTWCDTDSCISTSKCYCHRSGGHGRKGHSHHTSHRTSSNSDTNNNHSPNNNNQNGSENDMNSNQQKKGCKKSSSGKEKKSKEGKSRRDNLGLDYELFTVSGSKTAKSSGTKTGKSVKAHEALSVKKSVEVAAIFADVKLSQTTDISTLVSSGGESTQKRSSSGSVGRMNNLNSGERKNGGGGEYGITKSDMGVVLREKSLMKIRLGKPEGHYQTTNARPVSASGLEDSLGYLP